MGGQDDTRRTGGRPAGDEDGRLGVEDVAGSVAARRALGPDAEEAVIQAFLDRTGAAIDARVAERLAAGQQAGTAQRAQQVQVPPLAYPVDMPMTPPPPAPPQPRPDRTPLALAIVSLVAGIPLTGIATQVGTGITPLVAVLVIWVAISVINVVYNRHRD